MSCQDNFRGTSKVNSSTQQNDSQSFMVYFYPVFYGQNFQYVSIIVDLSTLQELSAEDRSAYILMQRIMPGLQTSVMTRQGQLKVLQGGFLQPIPNTQSVRNVPGLMLTYSREMKIWKRAAGCSCLNRDPQINQHP